MTIRDAIKKNIKEIPYEGQEVNLDGIESLIVGYLKGMVTFSHTYIKTNAGYEKDGKHFSREEIVQKFIRNIT